MLFLVRVMSTTGYWVWLSAAVMSDACDNPKREHNFSLDSFPKEIVERRRQLELNLDKPSNGTGGLLLALTLSNQTMLVDDLELYAFLCL